MEEEDRYEAIDRELDMEMARLRKEKELMDKQDKLEDMEQELRRRKLSKNKLFKFLKATDEAIKSGVKKLDKASKNSRKKWKGRKYLL